MLIYVPRLLHSSGYRAAMYSTLSLFFTLGGPAGSGASCVGDRGGPSAGCWRTQLLTRAPPVCRLERGSAPRMPSEGAGLLETVPGLPWGSHPQSWGGVLEVHLADCVQGVGVLRPASCVGTYTSCPQGQRPLSCCPGPPKPRPFCAKSSRPGPERVG